MKNLLNKPCRNALLVAAVTGVVTFSSVSALLAAEPVMKVEKLDRGLVAIPTDDGVYIGWRMLGTEPDGIAFNVYRSVDGAEKQKINDQPITDSTNLVDADASGKVTYTVEPMLDGKPAESAQITVDTSADNPGYMSIPIDTPEGYNPGDGSVADLDGDGDYEIILKQEGRAKDNSQSGETDPVLLQAYTLEGEKLWEINLGINIRGGAHYTQFQVFDYDGDGRAELICKTANGTTDGVGTVIGVADADHRNEGGYILEGPEFLTVFDGLTGAAIDTIRYEPQRAPGNDNPTGDEMKALWGDGYGNRMDRFLAGTAYLDGEHPSAIFSRGYYTRTYVAAYDFRDGKLQKRWLFDSENPRQTQNNTITAPSTWEESKVTHGNHDYSKAYSGQGFHSLSVADVDGDGKQEIVFGAMTIDDDGNGLYTTGIGHGDAQHVGDLDPDNPGIEIFGIQERFDDAGAWMSDAATGKLLWKKASVKAADKGGDKGEGPGRGVAFNIDPTHPGAESWTAGAGLEGLWDAQGNQISDAKPESCNFAVWWDGDLLRELLNRNNVSKWNWETQKTDRLLTAEDCRSNNGTKSTPTVSADLMGDWREEFILPTTDGAELRVFTTTIPTEHRLRTLMHDPQYRVAVAWQNSAYNQPPHPSFYMDPAMEAPAQPNVTVVEPTDGDASAAAE